MAYMNYNYNMVDESCHLSQDVQGPGMVETYPSVDRNSLEVDRNSLEVARNSLEVVRNSLEVARNSLEVARNSLEDVRNNLEFGMNNLEVARNNLEFGMNSLEIELGKLQINEEVDAKEEEPNSWWLVAENWQLMEQKNKLVKKIKELQIEKCDRLRMARCIRLPEDVYQETVLGDVYAPTPEALLKKHPPRCLPEAAMAVEVEAKNRQLKEKINRLQIKMEKLLKEER